MIYNGANINLVNNEGETGFFVLCKICNYEVESELLKYGTNPYLKDNENNLVIYIFTKYICTYEDYYNKLKTDLLPDLGYGINEKKK